MTMYNVSPQEAYINGGEQRGELHYKKQQTCTTCGQQAAYYSMAGLRELNMTGFCEPCFDYTLVSEEDRETLDAWMSLVKRITPSSQPNPL